MTRREQLLFCEKCTHRKMDMNQGILCGLTNEKATFTDSCSDFTEDMSIQTTNQEERIIYHSDLKGNFSDKNIEKFKAEQNFSLGLILSILTGTLGAILWALITVSTKFQIGYMAIAIGAAVGFTMRYIGKGIDQKFGIAGAIIAIFSCALGNLLSIIGFIAENEGLSYFQTLIYIDYSYIPRLMKEGFRVMDLLFYGFAAYEGYRFAFRVFKNEDFVN